MSSRFQVSDLGIRVSTSGIRDAGLNDLEKLLHAAVVARLGRLEFWVLGLGSMDAGIRF